MSTKILKDKKILMMSSKTYNVIIHNDHETTFECVIDVLTNIFDFSDQEASITAMAVHKIGKAIVGSFPRDIAESKKMDAISLARDLGYPLLFTVEEA